MSWTSDIEGADVRVYVSGREGFWRGEVIDVREDAFILEADEGGGKILFPATGVRFVQFVHEDEV